MATEELMIKLILLGNGSVGKTSLATRFAKNTFKSEYQPSIGVNLLVKMVAYQDQFIKVLVFDTAGQEFMSSLRKQHYTGANGAVIVFDLSSRVTFDNLVRWVDEVREEVGDLKTIIVGNKIDLEDERVISYDEALSYSKSVNAEYLESSAKEDIRVNDIFQPFIEEAVKQNIV
ncbi:MAG: GTP-binding protein [Candidatus Heimdallarchaeota archaeon]|nr:GTP-binding protein [Candidatus Heimdallarchaeota archaeon]